MKNKFRKLMAVLLSVAALLSCLSGEVLSSALAASGGGAALEMRYTLDDVAAGAVSMEEYEAYLEQLYSANESAAENTEVLSAFRSLMVSKSSDVTVAVGKENIYKQGHIGRVRKKEGNDLSKVVYENADGSFTQYSFAYPVKVADENGRISDVSLKIVSDGTGGYRTEKGNTQVSFPENIAYGISVSGNGGSVRLVPNGIFSAVSQQDEYNVSYVYDDKTTLDYSLTYTGVKENIVVREYTGRTEYEFTLYTGGLELKNSDGSYYLADENGEKWGSIGNIIIFTADGKNNTVSRMTHETVVPCEQYTITVHVDDQYLRDEKTVYPIRIDPMIEISYNTYGAIAFDDATINSDNTMDGTSNILYIGKRDGVKSRVIMRIREGRLGDIPSTRHVNAASVYMTNILIGNDSLDFTPMNVMTYMYSGSDWDDTSTRISSGNFDSYAHYMSARDIDTPYQRYGFDITNAVKFWMMNEHFTLDQGLLLKAPDTVENGSEDLYKAFASFDYTMYQPSMWINYSETETYTSAPFGWLDVVDISCASGWVWCFDEPDKNLGVKVYIDNLSDSSVGQICLYSKADKQRLDVNLKGYFNYKDRNGGGNYGFFVPIDWSQYPPGYYKVVAKAFLDQNNDQRSDNGVEYVITHSPMYFGNYSYQPLDEGEYYINNTEYGKYLRNNGGAPEGRSGLLADLSTTIKWDLINRNGGYLIRSKSDPELYLAVSNDVNNIGVEFVRVSDPSSTPDRCIWDMTISGGCLLRSRFNARYLTGGPYGSLTTREMQGDIYSQARKAQTWRIVSTSEYGNTADYYYREVNISVYFKQLEFLLGESSEKISVRHPNVRFLWCDIDDFRYLCDDNKLIFNSSTSNFSSSNIGLYTVQPVHKASLQNLNVFTVRAYTIIKVNNYYDKGFYMYYGMTREQAEQFIRERNKRFATRVRNELSIEMDINIEYYESYLDRIVNPTGKENLDSYVVPSKIIADKFQEYIHSIENYSGIGFLWTAYRMAPYDDSFYDVEVNYNRSFGTITGNEVLLINRFDPDDDYTLGYNALFYHELCHRFGTEDHYHEDARNIIKEGNTCANDGCITCHPGRGYSEDCIMNNPGLINSGKFLCDGCKRRVLSNSGSLPTAR